MNPVGSLLARLSIRWKLILFMMLPTGFTLVLASLSVYAFQREAFTRTLKVDLAIQAKLIGSNVRGALAFDDRSQGKLVLESLRVNPNIEYAVVYSKGKLFATFSRDGTSIPADPVPSARSGPVSPTRGGAGAEAPMNEGEWVDSGRMTVVRRFSVEGGEVGAVAICSSLDPVLSRLAELRRTATLGVALFLVIAFLLSVVLQRAVSGPILELTRTAAHVSTMRDYSVRAAKLTEDELGTLTDRFNDVLQTVQTNTATLESMARNQKTEAERKTQQQREVARLLESHVETISQVAQGDLTVAFREGGTDELTVLSRHLNKMIQQIARLIGQMQETVIGVGSTTNEIETTVALQTENFMRHTEVAGRTGESVEQLRGSASKMADQAAQVVRGAVDSGQHFEAGERALSTTMKKMEGVARSSLQSGTKMQNLLNHLDRIDDILSTVNDVAEQSKLLALNAAIEAARAGSTGKGFSVVAMEVRNLALQSKEASGQIKKILQDIRQASEVVSAAFSHVESEITAGKACLEELNLIHRRLKSSLEQSRDLAQLVEMASASQFQRMDEITNSIRENIQRMDQNLQSSRSIQEAMSGLSDLARSLRTTVKLFRFDALD